jgi:nicotinate dehydrogenase subunit A
MSLIIWVNGAPRRTAARADCPLLCVLRNDFGLNGPKFGCGLGRCGACTVLLDGVPAHSCVIASGDVGERHVTTLEAIGTAEAPHPIQAAFIAEQAAQCGYCSNGMLLAAKFLLDHNPDPTEPEIRRELSPYLCRCGSHPRIVRAVLRAASAIRERRG